MEYVKTQYRDRASKFRKFMSELSHKSPVDAINYIYENGYNTKESGVGGSLEVLIHLAENEPDKTRFLKRMDYLENKIKDGIKSSDDNAITLSTIHSSKGLEYDTVYMVDVYDNRLPSNKKNPIYRSKDSADCEQEERRLFYVGITRAKNKLVLINMLDRECSYIYELLPEARNAYNQNPQNKPQVHFERSLQDIISPAMPVITNISNELNFATSSHFNTKRQVQISENSKQKSEHTFDTKTDHNEYLQCFHEAHNKYKCGENPPYCDHTGRKWYLCKECKRVKIKSEFFCIDDIDNCICKQCTHNKNK